MRPPLGSTRKAVWSSARMLHEHLQVRRMGGDPGLPPKAVSSYTEAEKVKPVYLMKDVSKQESKQEALDDHCLVRKMP